MAKSFKTSFHSTRTNIISLFLDFDLEDKNQPVLANLEFKIRCYTHIYPYIRVSFFLYKNDHSLKKSTTNRQLYRSPIVIVILFKLWVMCMRTQYFKLCRSRRGYWTVPRRWWSKTIIKVGKHFITIVRR